MTPLDPVDAFLAELPERMADKLAVRLYRLVGTERAEAATQALADAARRVEGLDTWPAVAWHGQPPRAPLEDRVVVDRAAVLSILSTPPTVEEEKA